jgi:hypothetical protein
MASVFPYTNGTATTDSFSDPLSTSPLNSPSHSQLHQDINTAVETIESVLQSGGGSRNILYNGAMQVAQRGTSTASISTNNYFTADRWRHNVNALGVWTDSVENDAPTGSGFRKSLKILCTTADASPASGDEHWVGQVLEGQDLQAFRKGTSSAQQFTVSFWVKANVTGTYICELYDADNTRQVSKSYTISSSATWEFKTLTFGADTTGAFDNDNAASLYCVFWLGAGSAASSGTLNTSWASVTTANRAVGQTNLASATNNYWQITGVQLNVGAVAAPFEFKSYGRELAECQRYYWRHTSRTNDAHVGGGVCYTSTQSFVTVPYPVPSRSTSPTLAASATNVMEVLTNGAVQGSTGIAFQDTTDYTAGLVVTVASGLTAGGGATVRFSAAGNYFEMRDEL